MTRNVLRFLSPLWDLIWRGLVTCVVLCPATGYSLDPARTVYQYGCENWSRRNGLPVNAVRAIAQTADGYLWLGTQQGLVRFDGIGFAEFPVDRDPMFVSQNISTLARSRQGGLWFGLKEGSVGHFDGRKFTPLAAPWVEPNMQVFSLTESRDGSLWVGWNFGYARWVEGSRRTPAPAEQSIGFVPYQVTYEDPAGRIWLATGDSGQLYYWQSGERHAFPDETLANCYFFAIAVDAAGDIWVGTQLGLRRYDANFRRKALPLVTEASQVNALLIDRHGVLWVGMEGTGLLRYKDESFTVFNTSNGLVDDHVTALFEDTEGSLWVGTRGGLSQLTDVKFPIFSQPEGLLGEPLGVAAASDGGVWVGTRRGINHIRGQIVTGFSAEAGLENNYIKRVWEAANGDLYYFDGNRGIGIFADGKVVAHHRCKEWPVSITEDAEGVIVAVGGELCRVTRDAVTPFVYDDVAPALVWSVNLSPARDGSLWVAGHRGVWQIKGGKYRQWSQHNGLSGTVANWIFEDTDGVIWAGLATGVARIKNGKVSNISQADGLFADFIHAIVPDESGWFWFDSAHGVFRVRRKNLNEFADGKTEAVICEAFNAQHAIKTTDKGSQEPTAGKARDGRIWFPTAQGVVVIDPANVPVNRIPPPVYIQRMRINGVNVAGKTPPSLSPGRGELEFHYAALSFVASQEIRYRYQLEGYDEAWVDAGDRRSAFYTNLKPGHYTYRVQACNADGIWSPEGDSVAIELPPLFVQTKSFMVLCGFIGVAGLAGLYTWRTRTLRHRESRLQQSNDLLEKKVQERTAELALTNASLTEEVAERKRFEAEAGETNQQLILASRQAGMAEVATSVLHNVGNVLNSVNVSTCLIVERLQQSKVSQLSKLARLLEDNAETPDFLSADTKGKQVPGYIQFLATDFMSEQTLLKDEVTSLQKNVEHIKDIVQMQQTYSKMGGLSELVTISEILVDALRLNSGSLTDHRVQVERVIDDDIQFVVEKHKLLQILVNLINNAGQACGDCTNGEGKITLRVRRWNPTTVRIEVIDNGVGIPAENLTRIFTQGFTTRANGHGYGLHNSANAAQSMGGSLTAHSAGAGQGSTFVLDLPIR